MPGRASSWALVAVLRLSLAPAGRGSGAAAELLERGAARLSEAGGARLAGLVVRRPLVVGAAAGTVAGSPWRGTARRCPSLRRAARLRASGLASAARPAAVMASPIRLSAGRAYRPGCSTAPVT